MTIYIADGKTVKTYPVYDKVAKAVMALLEMDPTLMWSEKLSGYGVRIVDKTRSEAQNDD